MVEPSTGGDGRSDFGGSVGEPTRTETLRLHHVIEAQEFNRHLLELLFASAGRMEDIIRTGGGSLLRGRVMASLFYEESTRTRFSFESAMHRLGGSVISTENARQFSSVSKGETLEDTIRILNGYADVIVLRHYEAGAAKRAAQVSTVPIINGGDGTGQHPTQAFLDLYTIQREIGHIDGITIAVVGDLANGRTVRSLCYMLTLFQDVRIVMVAPAAVRMHEDIRMYLTERGIAFDETDDLMSVVGELDVLYQTRIQRERFASEAEYEAVNGIYVVTAGIMARMRDNAILMHPLPRIGEIDPEVDSDPRSVYFRQAQNGVPIRMAILAACCGVGAN
jgi:aspartate carbamoyltransferase catalytic subunit